MSSSTAKTKTAEAAETAAPAAIAVISSALQALEGWLERNEYAGYDPFDGLTSGLRRLTCGSKLGRQLLVQAVKRSPLNLRPWIGIRPATSSKGMGFLARGYLRWQQIDGDPKFLELGRRCLGWLRANPSPAVDGLSRSARSYSGLCWGNHFDYQTRTYYLPAGEPTVVWTALIGHAFVDAFELAGDRSDLDAACSICQFILHDLPRFADEKGTCIGYVTDADVRVHNASALAAGFLGRVFRHRPEPEIYDLAAAAMAYTAGHQNEDGSWFYGEQPNLRWVDNWHTAYVLDSLDDYQSGTGDRRFQRALERGWEFYCERFFLPDGCPKYYSGELYPIDIQCAAQGIETLCRFSDRDGRALELAVRVARWTIENMQDESGYFYFQRGRRFLNRTACFHWGQTTMLSALALLLLRLRGRQSSAGNRQAANFRRRPSARE